MPKNRFILVRARPKRIHWWPLEIVMVSCLLAFFAWNQNALGFGSSKPAPVFSASARIQPLKGQTVQGRFLFLEKPSGKLQVDIQLTGIKSGYHAVHLHETGDCSAPDGSSAGGHYNPHGHPHGGPKQAKRHVGDLGNVLAEVNGTATDRKVLEKPLGLKDWSDLVGRSVIVHAAKDDFKSQPSGNAGPRIGCGIVQSADTEPTSPEEKG